MTPSEKKNELIEKYMKYAHSSFDYNIGYDDVELVKNAIQCAIVCVDEIIASDPTEPISKTKYYETILDAIDDAKDYWNEVKNELNK